MFVRTFIWMLILLFPFTGWLNLFGIALATAIGRIVLRSALIKYKVHVVKRIVHVRAIFDHADRKQTAFRLALLIFLVVLPLFLNNYYLDILTNVWIYCILALGLNIVVGMTGLLDLGYISFYAVGAYSYALLSTKLGLPFWPGILVGGVIAALFGVGLGLVTLRLKGDYLAIVTLGFLHIVHLVLNNWDSLTNGPNGIMNIPMPSLGGFEFSLPIHFYYLLLVIVLLAVFTISRVCDSRIGRAWVSIREDEIAAASMGVEVVEKKVMAFAMGAFWAGVAGVLFAAKYAFISPESFTFFETVIVLAMVVLGGMGTMAGPIVGAVILTLLPEFLRGFASYRMLLFGLALIVMMIFRPQGLVGKQSG